MKNNKVTESEKRVSVDCSICSFTHVTRCHVSDAASYGSM